jgi:putative transposase
MRKPRKKTLGTTGQFHKMWRGHNREPVLRTDLDKKAYLEDLVDTYADDVREHVEWWGFCLLTNHTHEPGCAKPAEDGSFDTSIDVLGNWMRNAHSRFGQAYNKRNGRQGKVAYDRPKTTEIEDDDRAVLRVLFYCDANPVRAGLVRHPKTYKWSSHNFYARGVRDDVTKCLTPPKAYMKLGTSWRARQRKYAHLFTEYLRREGLWDDIPSPEQDASPIQGSGERAETSSVQLDPEEAGEALARGDPPPVG